jgi:hypothetical protein
VRALPAIREAAVKFDLRTLLAIAILYFAFKDHLPSILPIGPSEPQTILVVFEEDSRYMTTEFADLRTDIQAGADGQPFKAKGHRFLFIDNDTDSDVVNRFAPYKDETPEVIVFSGDKVKARFPTSYKATAHELAAALSGKGL